MMRTLSATVLVALFAFPTLAQDGQSASEGQGRGRLRQACGGDFQQYCADVPAGGGARLKCLRDHGDKLSDGCKTALAALQAARAGKGGGESKSPPASDDQK